MSKQNYEIKPGADLRYADLEGAILPDFQIPQNVTLTGYKRVGGCIVTLEIPDDAPRTASLIGKKRRCAWARVIRLEHDNGSDWGSESVTRMASSGTPETIYTLGQIVYPDLYNPNIRVECTHGIHFFNTKEEAIAWR